MSDADRYGWNTTDVIMLSEDPLPEGYDPDKLHSVVEAAADEVKGGTRAVLAEMRRQNPEMK